MLRQLGTIFALASAVLTLSLGGCASAPSTRPDADAAPPLASKADGATQFDEQTVGDTLSEDDWDTGATASIDDSGRLVYVVPTEVVEDGNLNDRERLGYRTTRSTYYYLDPVTGLPVLAPAAGFPGAIRSRAPAAGDAASSDRGGFQRGATRATTLPRPMPRVSPSLDSAAPMRTNRR